jgi:hypothetical protein
MGNLQMQGFKRCTLRTDLGAPGSRRAARTSPLGRQAVQVAREQRCLPDIGRADQPGHPPLKS